MTDIETELARKSITDVAYPNVPVTRQFLADVLAALRAKNKEIAELKERVAAQPPEPPPYDIVAHENVPSRSNPMAAAFAVNAAHGRTFL